MWKLDHKEGWIPKYCFLAVVWRRLLRVPWTVRRSNQSILKEISLEYSLKEYWNTNTLVNWCEELTLWKRSWCWEKLKAGGEWENRQWDGWMAAPLKWTWVWLGSGSWWWTRRPGMLQSIGSQWTPISDWTKLTYSKLWIYLKKHISMGVEEGIFYLVITKRL